MSDRTTLSGPPALKGAALLLRWPRPALRPASKMLLRNVRLYRRSWKLNLLPQFFEPLLYLLSIGFGLGLYIGREIAGVEYVLFIAPGLLAAAAMNGAIFEVTYNIFIRLRFVHLYDAVITTPLEPEDIALGELAWAVTRSVLYGTVFLSVTALLGYVRSPWALAVPLGVALIGLAFATLGMVYTGLVPRIEMFTYFFTLFVTPLFLFSGVFFPFENLPAGVRLVGWFTPLHHGVEVLRALMLTGNVATAAAHGLWLLTFSALLFPPAVNLFRRRLIV
jgi:lipooligosaccharide transport system permease protein